MHDDPKELPPQNPHESIDLPGDRDPADASSKGEASGGLTASADETRQEEGTASTERSTSPERITTPPPAEEGTPSVATPEPTREATPATGATTGAGPTATTTGGPRATAATQQRTYAPGERAAPPRPVEREEESSSNRGRWVAGAVAVAGATAAAPVVYRSITGHWPFQGSQAEPVHVRTTLNIHRPSREVYDFWRSLDHLPRFMRHLEEVETLDEKRSRWTARSPAGKKVSWEAEITEERPGELLAWRSVEGSEVETAGRVSFRDQAEGRGTRMEVDMRLTPPGGRAGKALADLLEPATERQIREDLRRFKNLMEAGEVPTNHEQPGRPGQAAATTTA